MLEQGAPHLSALNYVLKYADFVFSCRSICLLMQAALPCFLIGSGPGTMTLRGGTNAEMAPQIDYTLMVNINLIIAFAFNKPILRNGFSHHHH